MKKLILIILCLPLLGMGEYPSAKDIPAQADEMTIQRKRMVNEQIISRGVGDKRVLDAMSKIPRHLFVAGSLRNRVYGDHPLPIEEGQTISQPYVVAMMTEALDLKSTDRCLRSAPDQGIRQRYLPR